MNRLAFLPALVSINCLLQAQEIRQFTIQPSGSSAAAKTAHIVAAVTPAQDYIVEDSPDLALWNRVSPILRPSGTLDWTHLQAAPFPAVIPPLHITPTSNFFTRRFYRVRGLPAVGSGATAQSRLTLTTATRYRFVTQSGWTMTAEGTSCILTAPGGAVTLELWGTNGHENLNGQHVKDVATTRRTYLLPGDAIFTFNLAKKLPTDAGPTIQTISIHDADQSHRINLHTNSIESSSFSARVGEASEADGETARVWDTGAGVYRENIYTESVPANGQPLPQQAIPLARTYGPSQPNRVDDFFDDTRLGHT